MISEYLGFDSDYIILGLAAFSVGKSFVIMKSTNLSEDILNSFSFLLLRLYVAQFLHLHSSGITDLKLVSFFSHSSSF